MPHINRRVFVSRLGVAAATCAAWPGVSSSEYPRVFGAEKGNLASLRQPVFRLLPLGSVRPEGWLRRQLQIQAEGLSGHLDEFWPDVGQSQWFGGKAEGWERAPYWLDGFIPLAWVLGDASLQEKAKRYVDHIVAAQRPDGWYAPYPRDAAAKPYDVWSILLANKVLVQYHEATGDAKVLRAVMANLKAMQQALDQKPLFDWGRFRWFEGLIAVYYAYELTGESWLLDLARKLRDQGFDYMAFYASDEIKKPTPRRGKWTWEKHVVNTAMAVKAYPLSWRLTGAESERVFPRQMLEILDKHHGQVTGMFSGDECLAGRNPLQGTELCAVVETLYSLAQVISITGDASYADRLERIAFNALPAPFAPDMWSHQYDQQVNQAQCTVNPDHQWSTNGSDSNLYGLEPNYGCCTANMHQGWPKLAANLWMRAENGGIAAVAYAPSTADFAVRETSVRVALDTDYPFRETMKLTVTASEPARFPLELRIPAWADGATVAVNGKPEAQVRPGSFHRIEREWNGDAIVDMRFPMRAKATRRYHEAIAIERGPLVYALKLEEKWTRVNADKPQRELPHGDFEVRPAGPWNYGLIVDEQQPEKTITFSEQPVGARPFSPEGAGITAKAHARRLPGWTLARGWAGETPSGESVNASDALEEVTLIPYGCTNIRITEFPLLNR